MAAAQISYPEILEKAGFYLGGRPLPELVWSAEELRDAPRSGTATLERVERSFRYQAVLRPEEKAGRLGITDVYELSGSPCIYFKRLDADLEAERLVSQLFAWQKAAWNHGQAQLLWIVTPTQVRILNAYAHPPEKITADALKHIELARFEHIADQLRELSEKASREQIESQLFWSRLGKSVDRKTRVDKQLIKDLKSGAERLCERGLALAEAHRLLLRAVFASYLETRGWLKEAELREHVGAASFRSALLEPRRAARMFAWLASTFNGDVFPHDLLQPYTAEQLEELHFLLAGADPRSGQRYLWPYEFDVLPVELLSSIYEEFAHDLDPAAAKGRSVHYTPANVVDLTLSEVFADELFEEKLPKEAKVLDLSCGSGVFLVEALRRLVGRKIAAGERWTRKLVRDTLYQQVFGVDVSAGAVYVAAVSLYLAALELDPNPSRGNGVRFEPLVLPANPEKRKLRKLFNLFEADAFDLDADFNSQSPFSRKEFSVVVGNPPWTRPRGVRASAGASSAEEQMHIEYCLKQGITLPSQDPPDQAFVWRSADFATAQARFGLILGGRRFFGHHPRTVAARRELILRFSPKTMVNLSPLHREGAFPTAMQPAMIFIASNKSAPKQTKFALITPERNRAFARHGTLELGSERVQMLGVQRAAREPDLLKVASWGGPRDADLLDRLRSFCTFGSILEEIGIKPSQGFIRGKPEQRIRAVDRSLLEIPHPRLETEGFCPFGLDPHSLPPLEDDRMQWPRDAAIYRGPLLLISLGLGRSGLEAAFSEEAVVYSQRYYGVHAADEHCPWLECMNGILNSSLATYFLFLTSSEWGVERDSIPWIDIGRIPAPSPKIRGNAEARCLKRIVEKIRRSLRKGSSPPQDALSELDRAVFDLYGLDPDQRLLVQDMVSMTIDLYRKGEASAAKKPASHDDLAAYAATFTDVSNRFLSLGGDAKMIAEVFNVAAPLQIIKFRRVASSSAEPAVRQIQLPEMGALLEQIAKHLPPAERGILHVRRHLRVYGKGELYILKPNQRRYWTRSQALHDADAVLAEHMRSL